MSLDATLDVTAHADAVTFAFTISNAGDDSVELSFPDGCKADFVVESEGAERWRWSEGRMFTQMLETQTLAPGESVIYEGEWDAPEEGEYTARAALQATNYDLEATAAFVA
ncbi:BsuPI-related putative proteinase inhibitor [Halobacteriaceae archaeon GCM10025711]